MAINTGTWDDKNCRDIPTTILLQEIVDVASGQVTHGILFNTTPRSKALRTKAFKAMFPKGYALGNVVEVCEYEDPSYVLMGPTVEERHNSDGGDLIRYEHTPGYMVNCLDALHVDYAARGVTIHGWQTNLRYAPKKVRVEKPSPYRGPLVDRVAWRAAGRPASMSGNGKAWKWWTSEGLALVDLLCKNVGLRRPPYRAVSESGFYLKWYVPHEVSVQRFYAACDHASEIHNFPPVKEIVVSECPPVLRPGTNAVEHLAFQRECLERGGNNPDSHAWRNAAKPQTITHTNETHYFVRLVYDA